MLVEKRKKEKKLQIIQFFSIFIILLIFTLSCSYKANYRTQFHIRSIDTLLLLSGYDDIVLCNNMINLCDPVSEKIVQYSTYGLNTISIESYSQIRFTENNIFYLSVNDWNIHILDKFGKQIAVNEIPAHYNHFYPINETDYLIINPSSGEILYNTGFINKTFYMDRTMPFYEKIKYKSGIFGIQENDTIYIFKYTGELIRSYITGKIIDFSLINDGIICFEENNELMVYSPTGDRLIYKTDEYYSNVDFDNNKAVLYNSLTGQTLLIGI